MLKLEDAVIAAEAMLKTSSVGIIKVKIDRQSSQYAEEPSAIVEYHMHKRVGRDQRNYTKGESDEKIAADSLDYLASKVSEHGINVGVIPPQEVSKLNADMLPEIRQKYDLSLNAATRIYQLINDKMLPRSDYAAVFYVKKAPAQALGQMKLV
jgi:hypothetical protein